MKDFKFNILRFMLTKIYEADYNDILLKKKKTRTSKECYG